MIDSANRSSRCLLKTVRPFLGLALSILFGVTLSAEDQRPNILFLFTDDQPQNCLGVSGNKEVKTPHLDRLAERGIYFNNAFVTTAICCSNRASLLTGQHMFRHGIKDFKEPLSAAAFEQTYPALLRKAGYRVGYLGKYGIGNPALHERSLCLPKDQFDEWYGFPQSINFRQVVDGEPRYLTEVMTEKAVQFLNDSKSDQPFCLTVAFKEPHGPFNYFDPKVPDIYEDVSLSGSETFTATDWESQPAFIRNSLNGDGSIAKLKDRDRYQKDLRTFYRTVSRADSAVGEILAELRRLKLDENTVIIFSSDHGSLLGDHGLFGKWLMYENSIRVPLMVYDPRLESDLNGRRCDEMALSIDLAPTMLELAGVDVPAGMQGKSLVPVMRKSSTSWRTQFFYEHTYNTKPPRSPIPVTEGIRTDSWKYIRFSDTEPVFEQLFDLRSDPLERANLVADESHRKTLEHLRSLCDQGKEAR